MRFQLTQDELKRYLPKAPGLLAHCRRVAALAAELAGALALRPRDLPILEQAALLHHSAGWAPLEATDRLITDLNLSMPLADVRESGSEKPKQGGTPELPPALLSVLAEVNGQPDPASPEDRRPGLARIIAACNLFDEQMEWLPVDCRSVEEVIGGLLELADAGFLDHAATAALRDLTTRFRKYAGPVPDHLPASASMAHQVLTALSGRRDVQLRELEKIALEDPMMAAALIRGANSALYARSAPAATVREAIVFLGVDTARKILLATALRPLMRAAGLEEAWRHCVSTGLWCQKVAAAAGIAEPEEAMLLGLVHDIGRVAVRYLPSEAAGVRARLEKGGCPAAYVETVLLGGDHGEIGAGILKAWNFPEATVEAVRWHHQPERSTGRLAGLLYLAEFWDCSEEDLPSEIRLRAALQAAGLTEERLASIQAEQQPEDVLTLLLAA